MAVQFVYGAQSQYDALVSQSQIVDDALYFINDTQSIYRGSELIARTQLRFVSELPSESLAEDTLYVLTKQDEETQQSIVEIYVSDGTQAIKATSSKDEVDANKVFEALSKFTSADVKSNLWDNADDTKFITAGAVKEALEWTLMQN